jgi:hypothetical protein
MKRSIILRSNSIMQKILNYSLILALAIQSSSCFKKEPKKIRPDSYENSCEPNQFWLNESSIKEVGNEAHSGTHASVLNAETEYGIGVSTNIRNVIIDKVEKQLRVTCWVKAKVMNEKSGIGLSIFGKDGKHIHWNSSYFAPAINNNNEWTKYEAIFMVPAIEKDEAEFRVFVMNDKKGADFLVDDLKIEFTDVEQEN